VLVRVAVVRLDVGRRRGCVSHAAQDLGVEWRVHLVQDFALVVSHFPLLPYLVLDHYLQCHLLSLKQQKSP